MFSCNKGKVISIFCLEHILLLFVIPTDVMAQTVCLRAMAGGHQQLPNLCLSEKHWNSPSLFHTFWFARITLICLLYGQKSRFFLLFPIRLPLWTLNHLSVFQVFPSVFFSTWISYKPYNWLHLTSTAHLLFFLPCVSSSRSSNKLFAKTSLA